MAGILACVAPGIACIVTRNFLPVIAMAGFGIAAAIFNAFQTFMRGEAPPGGLARATDSAPSRGAEDPAWDSCCRAPCIISARWP